MWSQMENVVLGPTCPGYKATHIHILLQRADARRQPPDARPFCLSPADNAMTGFCAGEALAKPFVLDIYLRPNVSLWTHLCPSGITFLRVVF